MRFILRYDEGGNVISIAWIMHMLGNHQDFYADASTFVKTESMRGNSKVASDMATNESKSNLCAHINE